MTIANEIIIEATVGKDKELKPLLNDLVASVLNEKGCQKFELYQRFDERSHFFIIEIWKSNKAYEKHLNNEVYKDKILNIDAFSTSQVTHALKLTQCLTELGLKAKQEKK